MIAAVEEAALPVDIGDFKRAASHWATGCAVITTREPNGRLAGLTMSAVTSLSLNPMQFLVCFDRSARTLSAIEDSGRFAINLLTSGQEAIATRFASRRDDKFEGVAHRFGQHDVPILEGCLANIVCSVARLIDGGDHVIVIGNVLDLTIASGEPLVHFRGGFGRFLPAAAA